MFYFFFILSFYFTSNDSNAYNFYKLEFVAIFNIFCGETWKVYLCQFYPAPWLNLIGSIGAIFTYDFV